MMFLLVLMSSSCKKEEPLTSGELYPSYLGKWMNDSTYKNGFNNTINPQLNFEFQDIKALITAKNDSAMHEEFNWYISGSIILKNVKTEGTKYY